MSPFHLGLHIPLIIRLPGAKPLVSDALVSELDLLPTLLDLLGVRYDSPLHGKSLKPILEAQTDATVTSMRLRQDHCLVLGLGVPLEEGRHQPIQMRFLYGIGGEVVALTGIVLKIVKLDEGR